MSEKSTQSTPKVNSGLQLDRVRRICRSILGIIEKLSHGEPTFLDAKARLRHVCE
jgi:hypothetical protein